MGGTLISRFLRSSTRHLESDFFLGRKMDKSPKIAIVSSKELGTDCWSALRFTGNCHQCKQCNSRYRQCKLKEAKQGRLTLAENKLKEVQEHLDFAQKEVDRRRKEL